MSLPVDQDPWLGTIEHFPTVLHARASIAFDVNIDTVQKAVINGLSHLQHSSPSMELSPANPLGPVHGTVEFKAGIGNREGFDILDRNEEERVLRRIESRGPFETLDFTLELRYKIRSEKSHRFLRDRYLARLSFQPERVEVLIHHLKGLKRVQPDELVQLLVSMVNSELTKAGYGKLESEILETD